MLSITFLPALLYLLAVRVRTSLPRENSVIEMFGKFVVRRSRQLFWGSLLIATVLVASIFQNSLNDVFLHYFDDSDEFRKNSEFIVNNLTGLYAMECPLPSRSPGGIRDLVYLSDVEAFAQWYRGQPETIRVNVITETFRRLNKSMNVDDPAYYRLPTNQELAAQYLLLYEISLPYGFDLNNQIDINKSATRMIVRTRTLSSNEVITLDQCARQWLVGRTPNISGPMSAGTTLMFANLGRRNIVSMLVGTTLALVGISFILIFVLRSWRLGITSMVPNLIPGALGFGIWGLTFGQVGVSLSMVTPMTFRYSGRRHCPFSQQIPANPARTRLHLC